MIEAAFSGQTEAGENRLRFFIVRSSKRRTMQLRVGVRGVEVRAPSWVPESEIGQFVLQKKDWIERAVKEAGHRTAQGEQVLSAGGTLYVLGAVYRLEVVPVDAGKPWLEEMAQGWRVKGDSAAVRRLLVKWYQLGARSIFSAMVRQWAQRMSMHSPKVMVKDQQRLWGSYSARTKTVNLNWRMMAFPPEIIEYIVIHELCHAKHLDHSRSFWNEVALYCPDWKARRLWLRTSAQKYLF
jgi:predicted metal-dependent hydrolase